MSWRASAIWNESADRTPGTWSVRAVREAARGKHSLPKAKPLQPDSPISAVVGRPVPIGAAQPPKESTHDP